MKEGQRDLPVVPGLLIPKLVQSSPCNTSAPQHPCEDTRRRRGFPGNTHPTRWEHCLDKDFKILSPTESETTPSFEQGGA